MANNVNLSMSVQSILENVLEALHTRFGDALVSVVLFGSHAQGKAGSYSDLDFLVVAERVPRDWRERGRYRILSRNREIARAYLKEAAVDVNSARLLVVGGEYSQTIVHCQHVVEKILKAALAVRNIIITREHIVSPEFVRVYSDWDEAEEIGLVVSTLEKEGTRTEYPFFGRPDLPI